VERSRLLADRIGDPVAKVEADDQVRNIRPSGERWREIGKLEREIKAERQASPESPKTSRKPGGFTH
jgi:NDP-sugar pyrophosphorylase family protein